VNCNDEDTYGRARVTTDEEQVLYLKTEQVCVGGVGWLYNFVGE